MSSSTQLLGFTAMHDPELAMDGMSEASSSDSDIESIYESHLAMSVTENNTITIDDDSDDNSDEATNEVPFEDPAPVEGQLMCVICQGGVFKGQPTVKCGICTNGVVHLACASQMWLVAPNKGTKTMCPMGCKTFMAIRTDHPDADADVAIMEEQAEDDRLFFPLLPSVVSTPEEVPQSSVHPIFFSDRRSLEHFAYDLGEIICNFCSCTKKSTGMCIYDIVATMRCLAEAKKYAMANTNAATEPTFIRGAVFEAIAHRGGIKVFNHGNSGCSYACECDKH